MGCCGEDIQYSTMDFSIELYDLVQDPNKKTKFQFKKLASITTEKLFSKTLLAYMDENNICGKIGDDFKFSINNSLFYCYLNNKYAIVKNYLQVKELVPLTYETLFKISIVLLKDYNQLFMPKINLINKSKNIIDLNDKTIDMQDVMLSRQYIFNPNLSLDKIIFLKPNLVEDLDEGKENDDNDDNKNEDSQNESKDNNSNNGSVYDNNSENESDKDDEE